ncbi:hypothetical protein GpartN1_g6547.t1 [Galdieria partita]|uniref:30S ribosomal protein S8 n=1 Tax=Galdieria partita TaxID=83374 RepID=A0A9C7UT61_9RHOD|nr:hypothetical protein GpartN1_g6547.t1 [Galdieria partita]
MKNSIVHFVSKIKNGRHKAIIEAPFNAETWEVAQALQRGGYIRAAAIDDNTIRVLTKPFAIQDIKLLSKSSRPVFTDIPKYCDFIDQKLLWTPEGIFWDFEARKKRLGGEVILRIR